MTLASKLFTDRASGKDDYPLIVDSFKKSIAVAFDEAYKRKAESGAVRRKRWAIAKRERDLLDRVLALPSTECRVLVSRENAASIAGWAAWSTLGPDLVVVHFAYAKFPVRPLGCGDVLFQMTGAAGKRLAWTFGGAVAEKLSSRLVAAGRVLSAVHLPPKDFLEDMGDDDGRREAI